MKNSQNDEPVTEAYVSVFYGTDIVADRVAVDIDGYISIFLLLQIFYKRCLELFKSAKYILCE